VRTASQVISEMALQGRFHEGANSPFEKDTKLQKGAMGLPGYEELIKNDYPTILKAFNQQWTNLLQTIGSPLMAPGGPVIQALSGLANAMGALAQSAGSGALKSVIGMVTELGSIIIKLDTMGIRALSFVTGIGAVFEVFGRLPWATISAGLAAVNAGLSGLAASLDKLKGLFGIGGANAKPVDPNFEDRWDALKHKSLFNPGTSQPKVTPISLSLNVDGRTLAQTMADLFQDTYEHSTSAPAMNDHAMFGRADGGMMGT
jgi:hypothetical protein